MKDFNNSKQESLEILNKVSTLNILLDIKKEIEEKMQECDNRSTTEIDYFCSKERTDTFYECIELINKQIKLLSQ